MLCSFVLGHVVHVFMGGVGDGSVGGGGLRAGLAGFPEEGGGAFRDQPDLLISTSLVSHVNTTVAP